MRILISILIIFTTVACGHRDETKAPHGPTDEQYIALLQKNDVALVQPQPGEWLFEHQEPGQTFEEYIQYNPVSPDEKRKTIYLLPIGFFNDIQQQLIHNNADYLSVFFNLPITILPAVSDTIISSGARRIHYGVEQFNTIFILDYLEKRIPEDGIVIMAITANDLYPSNDWNFVFGQARLKQRVGVSSIYRLSEKTLTQQNYPRCLERLIRTSSHEIGHMFSCLHCTSAICLMNGSNSLQESDRKPNRLCSECLHKFHWILKFDIAERNESLLAFFQKHDLQIDEYCAEKDRDKISNLSQRK